MSTIINSTEDLCNTVGTSIYEDPERTEGALSKAIFKGTSCGAWVHTEAGGVTVGSIVEGADECTEAHQLYYPFNSDQFWKALEAVEREANEIWKDTHGCEHCWPDGYFDEWCSEFTFGGWPINPDCEMCKGEGVIL